MHAKPKLVEPAPTIEKQGVGRRFVAEYGRDGQKYLTADQVALLIKAARDHGRGLRDVIMIALGMRVSELADLRESAIDWKRADMAVTRLKNGDDTRQPLLGDDLRALRALYRERASDEYVFMSERGPFTRDGFAKLLKAAAARAGIENAHTHALRLPAAKRSP